MKSFIAQIFILEQAATTYQSLPLPIITIRGDERAWVGGVMYPTETAARKEHPMVTAHVLVQTMEQKQIFAELCCVAKIAATRTENYDIFDAGGRLPDAKPILLASFQEHGFMPCRPILCQKNSDGKMLIINGHHRFALAKKLKLPVYYIVTEGGI